MRITLRAATRLALVGVLAAAAPAPSWAQAAAPAEETLPASTIFFLKVNNAAGLRESLRRSQFGQLLDDPAMKPLLDDISAKLQDVNGQLKQAVGVTLGELYNLPQGAASLAVVPRADAKPPVAILLTADAGKDADRMEEVMNKATDQAEKSGTEVSSETFQDLKLRVLQPEAAADQAKDDDDDDDGPAVPIIWTRQGTIFHLATDVDALKDVLSQADARDDSLAKTEAFGVIQEKAGRDAQLFWMLDLSKVFEQISRGAGPNAQQIDAQLDLVGIKSLKAIGGGVTFGVGQFDYQSQTYLWAPGQAQGLLRLFPMPQATLKPQPWVPASVSSYQTISWDLDKAWSSLQELANQLAPGALDNIQKQLAGPQGKGLDLQKDLFGPLGDRVSIVSDYKKPITEESQPRMLLAIALEDPKTFEDSLNKLFDLANANPKTREFQGTTIYDIELPNAPQAGGDSPLQGPLSVAIAKDSLLVATEPTFLEQVLRGGDQPLADNPEFQAVAEQYPPQSSTASYQRPEEQARVLYTMVKSGQLQKAVQNAPKPEGAETPEVLDIDPEKLPEFSVFAKYLAPSGGFAVQEPDGMTLTRFTLKKTSP